MTLSNWSKTIKDAKIEVIKDSGFRIKKGQDRGSIQITPDGSLYLIGFKHDCLKIENASVKDLVSVLDEYLEVQDFKSL